MCAILSFSLFLCLYTAGEAMSCGDTEKEGLLPSAIKADEPEPERSDESLRVRIINYVVVIFFGLGLIFSGGYALFSKHKTIKHEKALVELKAQKRGHAFDGIPRCIVLQSSREKRN